MFLPSDIAAPMRARLCIAALSLGMIATSSQAQGNEQASLPAPPPAPPSHLVRQLLEHDARQALAHEMAKSKATNSTTPFGSDVIGTQATTQEPATAPKPPAARLLAIVGVGNRLVAHIQVGSRQAGYLAGEGKRVAGPDLGIGLVRISPPCATFDIRGQDVSTHCLDERAP